VFADRSILLWAVIGQIWGTDRLRCGTCRVDASRGNRADKHDGLGGVGLLRVGTERGGIASWLVATRARGARLERADKKHGGGRQRNCFRAFPRPVHPRIRGAERAALASYFGRKGRRPRCPHHGRGHAIERPSSCLENPRHGFPQAMFPPPPVSKPPGIGPAACLLLRYP
jgi:hypothetical protein